MSRQRCYGFHAWTKWQDATQPMALIKNPSITWTEDRQLRHCRRCGKKQTRELDR